MRDDRGEPIRVVGSGVDITDLKRTEEALRASERRFRALVQNSSDIISLFDADGTILYQSPSMERLLGHRPQDRIGRNVFSDPIVHSDDRDAKRVSHGTLDDLPWVFHAVVIGTLLMWLYYSCQVILMGAEFTHSYARTFGDAPVPKEYAAPVGYETDREGDARERDHRTRTAHASALPLSGRAVEHGR